MRLRPWRLDQSITSPAGTAIPSLIRASHNSAITARCLATTKPTEQHYKWPCEAGILTCVQRFAEAWKPCRWPTSPGSLHGRENGKLYIGTALKWCSGACSPESAVRVDTAQPSTVSSIVGKQLPDNQPPPASPDACQIGNQCFWESAAYFGT